ncbi:substrate-binding domain-containing protein [Thalassobellus sediminis]|uniref:substrate-binding domain-containing protein n=1 Tax=Thalassobellus sediminis TaxID=3367753 RepID=UPI0037B59DDC
MITIKDIAKEANVSEGTVDRVLHNRGGVSKKTEAKIQEIIKKRNFSVNPVASALALKNNYKISALIPDYNDSDLFWKSPYLGILKASEDVKNVGTQVNCFRFNQYDASSYLYTFKTLIKTKPTAVLLVPIFIKETKQIVNKLEKLKIPYMFLNIDIEGFKNDAFIGQDSYTAGYIAGKLMHLSLPGQSNFLIIQSRYKTTKNNAISRRIEGFNNYFSKNNIKEETSILTIDNLNNTIETKEKIHSFLKLHEGIRGIFIPSSRIHVFVDYIGKESLKKLKLIGFDNTPQNIACLKNDTVSFLISQKPFDQGYESIRLMVNYLNKKTIPNNKIYLPIDILTKENVVYNERSEFMFENENINNID